MVLFRRRVLLFAAAVSFLAFATVGAALSLGGQSSTAAGRVSAHQVVADHDAVVSARPLADRSPFDLRQVHSKLLLLAWVSVLLGAALLARTAGRVIEAGARRAGSAAPLRRRFDRGPPAASFA